MYCFLLCEELTAGAMVARSSDDELNRYKMILF